MRVLLVYPNTDRYLAPAPIGLAFLVPPLLERGHDVSICDLMFENRPRKALLSRLNGFRPHVVAFSIRNLDNQNMADPRTPLEGIKRLIHLAQQHGATTVLGGAAFSSLPCQMMDFLGADYGIVGQGEGSFSDLVDAVRTGALDTGIPGLVRREDGRILANPPDANGYGGKNPDWRPIYLSPYARRWHPGQYPGAVVIKTGCRLRCSFCNSPFIAGSSYRLRSSDEILADIEHIVTTKRVRLFFFVDTCFNHPLPHAKAVLRAIVQSGIKIHFMSNLAPLKGAFDDELFFLYKKAGGLFIMLGADSLSPTMLGSYRKAFRYDDIVEFSRLAKRHRLPFGLSLIFGGPRETEETIRESLLHLREIRYSLLFYNVGIRVLPHTELFFATKEEGNNLTEDALLFPVFYLSPELDYGRAVQQIRQGLRKYACRHVRMAPVAIRHIVARYVRVLSGQFQVISRD